MRIGLSLGMFLIAKFEFHSFEIFHSVNESFIIELFPVYDVKRK